MISCSKPHEVYVSASVTHAQMMHAEYTSIDADHRVAIRNIQLATDRKFSTSWQAFDAVLLHALDMCLSRASGMYRPECAPVRLPVGSRYTNNTSC